MKRNWQLEELIEHWTILPKELRLLKGKTEKNRLGLALLLKFYQYERQFPNSRNEVPNQVIAYVASQLKIDPARLSKYDFLGRTIKTHRKIIREFLGVREATLLDQENLRKWLESQVLVYELKLEPLLLAARNYLDKSLIEAPTTERLKKLVRSAIYQQEEKIFQQIAGKLSQNQKEKLDKLLERVEFNEEEKKQNQEDSNLNFQSLEDIVNHQHYSHLALLKNAPGSVNLDSWQKEAAKLQQLRQLQLPSDLFQGISPKILEIYKQRVMVEPPRELRRHPKNRRYTFLAAFSYLRLAEITDNLVELLIQIVHRIGARAEKKVDKELLEDFKKVSGKTKLLFEIAQAALENPEGTIKEVIYPVASQTTLENLVREFKSTGTAYREKVYTVMRLSYGHHYRRMIPILLELLEFRSNNQVHCPIIEALELLKKYAGSGERYYAQSQTVPIEGIVKNNWSELIVETLPDSTVKIQRINYELAVLQALRNGLRCKEIWVVGQGKRI